MVGVVQRLPVLYREKRRGGEDNSSSQQTKEPNQAPNPEQQPAPPVPVESEAIASNSPQQPTPSIGDTVSSPDGQRGVVELIYEDGQFGVQFDGYFMMWKPNELTLVSAAESPEFASPAGEEKKQSAAPTFEVGQPVQSKKGFKSGTVQGFAKNGRLIVEWRAGRKQTQTETVAPADVELLG